MAVPFVYMFLWIINNVFMFVQRWIWDTDQVLSDVDNGVVIAQNVDLHVSMAC